MTYIGVIGLGVIGKELVYTLCSVNMKVKVYDIDRKQINSTISYCFQKEFLNAKGNDVTDNIEVCESISDLAGCTLIFECISEKIEDKKVVINTLGKLFPDIGVCTTTSCIPIHMLDSFHNNDGYVIGTHFMNPISYIDTVEVIKSDITNDKKLDQVKKILNKIEKNFIVVKDTPGFVLNRISHIMMNEAFKLVDENIASADTIDSLFRNCYGHKMGPLETADLIGLDTVMNSLDVLFELYQDERFKCNTIVRQKVSDGYLGMKTGKGFYTYFMEEL